jgi:flotillin
MNTASLESTSNLALIGITAGTIAILAALIGFVMAKLYKRATKELAFVRTGLGGEKVIKDGGSIVIGIFHDTIDVNMNTIILDIERTKQDALITLDRMRVDVKADFYLRVSQDKTGIATAAQTLGVKTQNPADLKKLMESKFVDVLRSVASEMSMCDMHERRSEFVNKVQVQIKADLEKNGLELESVSLTNFDQTSLDFFNENNAFDAEGRAKLEQIIQNKKKETNDIVQKAKIEIEQRDLETTEKSLDISKKREQAELQQVKEIKEMKAQQESDIAIKQELSTRLTDEARVERERAVESATIKKVNSIQDEKIRLSRDIEVAEQDSSIAIAEKSEQLSAAKAKAAEAEKERVEKEEEVVTAREYAIANRIKLVAVTKATQEAEEEAAGITVTASAKKAAAQDEAEAMIALAKGQADSDILTAKGKKELYATDAEGISSINEAKNKLNNEQLIHIESLAKIEQLPNIISESVKPLLKIDGIKILQGYGAQGTNTNIGGNSTSNAGFAEQATNAALTYRANRPVVDNLLTELGFVPKGMGLEDLLGDALIGEKAIPTTKETPELINETQLTPAEPAE